MIKRWNDMDTFEKVFAAMVLLWAIGVCTTVAGYKIIGCVLIWSAVVIDVVAFILWNKRKERKERKDENNIQN